MNSGVNMIGKDTIDAVRSKTDIVKVVEETVSLKKTGNSWKGLCPFHDESTPSMHVTPDKNLWHCFGCGEGGDAIDYIRKRDALNFAEAVEILADKIGVEVHYTSSYTNQYDAMSGKKLAKINAIAENFFRTQWQNLPDRHPARTFLEEKDLHSPELIEQFRIGWAPHPSESKTWNKLSEHLIKEGFTKKDIIEAGLANENAKGEVFDKFRGRIIWPVRNPTGFVVGFGGRRIFSGEKEGPKYLNSPETVLYKKSDILYNLETARKHAHEGKKIIIVEGYTDVMALAKIGIPNSVAACGTAFGATHVAVLKRILGDSLTKTVGLQSGTVAVIFMFDGDEAGKKAALRVAESAQNLSAETYAVILPSGFDPSDMVKAGKGEELKAYIERKDKTLTQFAIETKISNHNITTPEGVALAVEEVAEILCKIPNPITKEQYIQKTAFEHNISEQAMLNAVKQAENQFRWDNTAGVSPSRHPTLHMGAGGDSVSDLSLTNPLNNPNGNPSYYNEEEILLVSLQNPHNARTLSSALTSDSFTSPLLRTAYAAIKEAYMVSTQTGEQGEGGNDVGAFRVYVFDALNNIATQSRLTLEEVKTLKETLNRLMVQQPKILVSNEQDLMGHTESVLRKAVKSSIEKQILQLKMEQAQHDPNSSTYTELWGKIIELQKESKKLNL